MAADDAGGNEPSLTAGMGASATGTSRRGARKLLNAARVGARANVEGVRSVVNEFDSLLQKLRQVRTELEGINKLQSSMGGTSGGASGPTAGAGGTGVGQSNPSLARFGQMTTGFSMLTTGFALSKTAGVISSLTGGAASRFNRNLQESIPISQGNMLLSSQYGGANYSSMEWDRVKALGQFNMNRTDTLAAQSIGLSYGQSYSGANRFLSQTVAPLVQASGGTLAPSQAAALGATFLDPTVMRRAQAMNIPMARQAGQVQNPLTTAMGYITDYQKRMGVKMNAIDFENLRSPGSSTRYQFKRLYSLSDDAIDTIVQAGLQNNTFTNRIGATPGVNINFSSASDLSAIGMSSGRLGMKAFQYMTAATTRETRFAATQSGAEVGKLNTDITIENTLSDVEEKFSSLLGPLGEFQKYIKLATGGLQIFAGVLMMRGLMGGMGGGGGGLLSGLGGIGVGGGEAGAAATTTAAGVGGTSLGMAGLGVAVGAGTAYFGNKLGGAIGGNVGAGVSFGADVAGGALIGGAVGSIAGPVGTLVGGTIGAGVGAVVGASNFAARSAADIAKAMPSALGMTDQQLIDGLKNARKGEGFGPKETARLDVWQMRRGALAAALIARVRDETSAFDNIPNDAAVEIQKEFDFFQSTSVTNDDKFNNKKSAFMKTVLPIISRNPDAQAIYNSIYGAGYSNPFDMNSAITTPEAQSLVMSSKDILGKSDTTGDPIDDKAAAKGATWDNLTPMMKDRLTRMFKASNGRVWLGNGWRSSDQQKSMFLSRYTPDPNGDITYNGQKYRHVSGAPAAPPGSSMHEIGLAADLEGDLSWVQQNAAQFGLKTFAGVNNEPWHVQPNELPNSRKAYEAGGGGGTATSGSAADVLGDAGSGTTTTSTAGASAAGLSGSAISGINFNITQAGPTLTAGSLMASTASSTTMGTDTSVSTTAGGVLTAEQIAKMAYTSGFRGAALTEIVAIAMRESHGNSAASNESYYTGAGNKKDLSYGLTQINILPWVQQGKTAPWTKDQLMDPQFNLNTAFSMYQQRGFQPWGIKGNPTASTDVGAAASAVQAAGYASTGDPMPSSGGSFMHVDQITLQATIQSSGQASYDAEQFVNVAIERLQEAADMGSRRAGR